MKYDSWQDIGYKYVNIYRNIMIFSVNIDQYMAHLPHCGEYSIYCGLKVVINYWQVRRMCRFVQSRQMTLVLLTFMQVSFNVEKYCSFTVNFQCLIQIWLCIEMQSIIQHWFNIVLMTRAAKWQETNIIVFLTQKIGIYIFDIPHKSI